jgi:hypothetical protein
LAASILGLVSQPIMWWSLYTLKTTGCGLPAGPFGLIGAAEGVSYLVVIGFVGAAILSKVTTGKGLPAGPLGLLGAAEGLSFLSAVAGLAVLGHYYFAAFNDSITSATALANPYDRSVTLGRDFIAAPPLAGIITDTHFMARARLGRLIAFLGRLAAESSPCAQSQALGACHSRR